MKEHRYTACGGVVVKGDGVLVLLRPSRDEVRLPKGHVEPGESYEQAAIREVFEETGYSALAVVTDLGEQIVEFDHEGRHYVRTERYFLMELRNPEDGPSSKGEAEFQPIWLTWPEALEKITFDAERCWLKRARRFISREGWDRCEP
jgi:8-oxo-dGTP pyrophosphatase MutT (NUDIX family)